MDPSDVAVRAGKQDSNPKCRDPVECKTFELSSAYGFCDNPLLKIRPSNKTKAVYLQAVQNVYSMSMIKIICWDNLHASLTTTGSLRHAEGISK